MILLKCCTQYANKFGKLSSGHKTGKGPFHYNPKERQCQRMFKLPYNCTHLTHQQRNAQSSPSQAFIVMNCKHPDIQAKFRKGRGTRDQISSICWIIEKARDYRKTSISACLTTLVPLTVWITTNCIKLLKRWEYQTI